MGETRRRIGWLRLLLSPAVGRGLRINAGSYVEGWWVAPDLRQQGVGRALFTAIEGWCRKHGYLELGSDAEIDNAVSLEAHVALGFQPTLRLQFFRKRL